MHLFILVNYTLTHSLSVCIFKIYLYEQKETKGQLNRTTWPLIRLPLLWKRGEICCFWSLSFSDTVLCYCIYLSVWAGNLLNTPTCTLSSQFSKDCCYWLSSYRQQCLTQHSQLYTPRLLPSLSHGFPPQGVWTSRQESRAPDLEDWEHRAGSSTRKSAWELLCRWCLLSPSHSETEKRLLLWSALLAGWVKEHL